MPSFHNPYHFVPVKRRTQAARPETNSPPLNNLDLPLDWFFDHERSGSESLLTHDRYHRHPTALSGRLLLRVEAEDPLVIGAAQREASQHAPRNVEPFKIGSEPAIPASTLRGLISSLGEAASNSSLRVLTNQPYSYRKPRDIDASLSAIGMVVEGKAGTRWGLRPLALPTIPVENDYGETGSAWAAVFPYPSFKVHIGTTQQTGDPATFPGTFETGGPDGPWHYMKLDSGPRRWQPGDPGGVITDGLKLKGAFAVAQFPSDEVSLPITMTDAQFEALPDHERKEYVRGIVRVLGVAGRSVPCPTPQHPDSGKKHELFVPYETAMESWTPIPIPDAVVKRFEQLADERTLDEADSATPEIKLLPYHPRNTIRNENGLNPPAPNARESEERRLERQQLRLKVGDLVYFDITSDGREVSEISYSSIWRGRPDSLDSNKRILKTGDTFTFFQEYGDSNLTPLGAGRTMLTLAEQIFGVVEDPRADDHRPAYALASRIRFSHGRLSPGGAYLPECTLRILDSPKLPSPALYFRYKRGKAPAARPNGTIAAIPKHKLSPNDHVPQGRKFYLHRFEGAANGPGQVVEPWKSNAQYPGPKPGHGQGGWKQYAQVVPLAPGTAFHFHIDFDNLRPEELGLVLYALRPHADFRHKLGMGKPLGLGKVRIDLCGLFLIERSHRYSPDGFFGKRYTHAWKATAPLLTQETWPEEYRQEREPPAGNIPDAILQTLRNRFESRMDPAIHRAILLLGNPSSLTAPVHPPATNVQIGNPPRIPEAELYRWHVNNSRDATSQQLKPLDELPTNATTLPTLNGN